MSGVGWISFLIIGIVAGFIAEKVLGRDDSLFINLIVGVVGAFVGGFLANALGIVFYGFLGSLIVSTFGAIICLYLWQQIRARR